MLLKYDCWLPDEIGKPGPKVVPIWIRGSLELLSIDENTKIKIKTDGESIIIIPIRKSGPKNENAIEEAYDDIVKKYSNVFRKLAKH